MGTFPVFNTTNAGKSVPVRFSLDGDRGMAILAAGFPKSEQIACDATAPADGIEETVTAGNSGLTYDPISDTYTYVWKTDRAWADTCRQLIIRLADGASYRANFRFTR